MQSQQEIQQLIQLLQSYQQTIEVLDQQRQLVERTIGEHEQAQKTLQSMEDLDQEGTIMVPVGADQFIYAAVQETERVLSSVGADVVVEEPRKKAIERTRERIDELQDGRDRIDERIDEITEEAEEIQERVQELYRQQQQ